MVGIEIRPFDVFIERERTSPPNPNLGVPLFVGMDKIII
jgi:hypothetical protein